jgi:hypothetical protein
MQSLTRIARYSIVSALMLLVACASTPASSPKIIKTLNELPPAHVGFTNLLVISVAGNFESRTLFERKIVSAVVNDGGRATAFFTVVGRRPQLARSVLETAIRARKFDAVVLTRIKGQERKELAQNRPVGAAFDLFAFDYAELNDPTDIQLSSVITFVTELYSVADYRKIWSMESLSVDKTSVGDLLNEQATVIASQINKDDLLQR